MEFKKWFAFFLALIIPLALAAMVFYFFMKASSDMPPITAVEVFAGSICFVISCGLIGLLWYLEADKVGKLETRIAALETYKNSQQANNQTRQAKEIDVNSQKRYKLQVLLQLAEKLRTKTTASPTEQDDVPKTVTVEELPIDIRDKVYKAISEILELKNTSEDNEAANPAVSQAIVDNINKTV